jgi:hypothetical protein
MMMGRASLVSVIIGDFFRFLTCLTCYFLASGFLVDADDTAKTASALYHLGTPVSISPLCTAFELENHFRCYPFERTISITVQCNVLSALLQVAQYHNTLPLPETMAAPILKVVKFIAETWWTTNKAMEDKWVRLWVT